MKNQSSLSQEELYDQYQTEANTPKKKKKSSALYSLVVIPLAIFTLPFSPIVFLITRFILKRHDKRAIKKIPASSQSLGDVMGDSDGFYSAPDDYVEEASYVKKEDTGLIKLLRFINRVYLVDMIVFFLIIAAALYFAFGSDLFA